MLQRLRPLGRCYSAAATKPSSLDEIICGILSEKTEPQSFRSAAVSKELKDSKDFETFLHSSKFSPSDICPLASQIVSSKLDAKEAQSLLCDEKCTNHIDSLSLVDCLSIGSSCILLFKEDVKELKIFQNILQVWEERLKSSSEEPLTLESAVSFLTAIGSRAVTFESLNIPTACKKSITKVILKNIRDGTISKTSDILAILKYADMLSDKSNMDALLHDVGRNAAKLLEIMSVEDVTALLRGFASQYFRDLDKCILPRIAARLSSKGCQLSISQVVKIAQSAVNVRLTDSRLLKALGSNVCADINNLVSVNDASSLINSFFKLRIGHTEAWSRLAKWINQNANKIDTKFLSIMVVNFARAGIDEARPAAAILSQSKKLNNRFVFTHHSWLSTMYSLAYFDVLTTSLAETVLGKEFLQLAVSNDKINLSQKVYLVMMILQIQAYVSAKFGKEYTGQTVKREQFADILDSPNSIAAAYSTIYGKEEMAARAAIWDDGLTLLAPTNRIGRPIVDESGVFCCARIVSNSSKLLVPVEEWGNATPRPVLYIAERQVLRNLDEKNGHSLLGREKLMLRLLDVRGIKPIVVFQQDIATLTTPIQRKEFFLKFIE